MKNRQELTVTSITLNDLKNLFGKGRFATVTFVKKSDGSIRTLNGKTNIQSALNGGKASYDAESRNQLRICDVNLKDKNGVRTKGYRTVTVDNVIDVRANKIIYKIVNVAPQKNFVTKIEDVNGDCVVELLGEKSYKYKGVGSDLIAKFQNAESKGQFFNSEIKPKFKFERL